MKDSSISSKERILLILILGVSCFLRFYKLAFQSFWLDELHAAIEADPALSWKELFFYLKCCDQQPPLFFAAEKLFFFLFGNTEFVARLLPAVAGTTGVWVIYLLGKEFYSVRLGLVAAVLTCFNYFHISYSQEARPYAFAFLFAGLSFLYLIRLIKNPNRKNSIPYSLFTLLMLYTHYFGLFAFASQIVISFVFWILETENKKLFLKQFVISGIIIFIGFAPWFPFLFSMNAIRSFWIKSVSPGFAIDFFYEYFGNSDLLKPFLILFLISALVHLFVKSDIQNGIIKKDRYTFSLTVCFLWISITFFIPFLRSILVIPMLYPRYTIVLLPAFIIILSFGVEFIKSNLLKYILLFFFCLLSLTDLFFIKKYYSEVHKTQFRELAGFIASDTSIVFPVVSEVTAWHQQYYLKKMGYGAPILEGKKETIVDSILSKSSEKYNVDGFWLSDAHGAEKPSAELLKKINSSCLLIKEKYFYDAWAQLYIVKDTANVNNPFIDYRSFSSGQRFKYSMDTVVAIWDRQAISSPFAIRKGKYIVNLMLRGDPASGVFPHLNIFINDQTIGSCYVTGSFENYSFSFETGTDISPVVKIIMDNDLVNKNTREDRNAFLKSILFIRHR